LAGSFRLVAGKRKDANLSGCFRKLQDRGCFAALLQGRVTHSPHSTLKPNRKDVLRVKVFPDRTDFPITDVQQHVFCSMLMQPTTKEKLVKKLRGIQRSADRHWVGDGFPVRTLFAYPNLGAALSPFLLFDYAGPMGFPPTDERLGVGDPRHPTL
jgi:hypothetical protein